MRDESDEAGTRHPNDLEVVREQLVQSGLTLNDQERAALIASIDRQIAEIDARKRTRRPR